MSTQSFISSSRCTDFPAIVAPQWFALQTSSRHEKQVALQLAGRGIEHFLPVYEEVHHWSDRHMKVEMPLFPGYLFVCITTVQKPDVVRVPGVAKLVGFHAGPVAIPTREIEALRLGCGAGTTVMPHPYLKTGCRIRVRSGALRGMEGILVRHCQRDRIVISVDLIMKSISLEIDSAEIEVIA